MTEKTKTQKYPPANAAQVLDFLRAHPDFLKQHPDLLAPLLPSRFEDGGEVIDLQKMMVGKLRAEVSDLSQNQKQLLDVVRSNLSVQERVHEAVLAMLGATSFEHLIHIVQQDLPIYLMVDVIKIAIEQKPTANDSPLLRGIVNLPENEIARLFGGHQKIILRQGLDPQNDLYQEAGMIIRSDVLVRLALVDDAPPAMIAFGMRDVDHFSDKQASDLILFLVRVFEQLIRLWLQ